MAREGSEDGNADSTLAVTSRTVTTHAAYCKKVKHGMIRTARYQSAVDFRLTLEAATPSMPKRLNNSGPCSMPLSASL